EYYTTDLRAGATHRPGLYHFAGHSAVIYMRIRKAGGGGDFMRTQRARTVMSTLADKCREITWEEAEALVNNIMDNNTMTNINLEEMLNAARYAYSLRDCTIEELRIPPDGAASPITFASMAVQEIDWEACRSAMANYLKNSFLVVEDD
ncbi:MAG: LCP family protein, partial [Clostridia bacterium]|nr:LCP family protein [Clostridia bacterium]